MSRVLLLSLILFNFLFAAYEKELTSFDDNFITSNPDTQTKYHQQLKSLYIQSVIRDDESTKLEILKRLVVSSNTLNLSDESYVSELEESGVSAENINNLKKATKSLNTQKKENETTQNTNSKLPDNSIIALNSSTSKNSQKIIYILNAKKNDTGMEFSLNTKIDKDDLKSFVLDEKGNYRHITDLSGVFESVRKDFTYEDYSIVISQYNPKTIRIVVRAKEKINVEFKFNENKVNLLASFDKKEVKKESEVKKVKKEEKPKEEKKPEKKDVKKENSNLYVLSVDKENEGVLLKLNQKLDNDEINISTTKDSKYYRYIYSFEGILEGGRKNYGFKDKFITITQFTPQIVRIVLSSIKEEKIFKELSDKSLILAFSNTKSTTKSTKTQGKEKTQKKTQSKEKKQDEEEVVVTKTIPKGGKNTLSSAYKATKLIVIDAGHGGKDAGAVNNKVKLKEKDIVLNTALKLGNELKKRGYKVLYTRSKDNFINLRTRTKYANDKKADLFLSIHANAAPTQDKARAMEGVETFFLSPARSERSKKVAEKENQGDLEEVNYFSKQNILHFLNREKIIASNKLAIDIQKSVLSNTRQKYKVVDGGVREAPFWVLVGAQMPAILLEIGYISHPSESKRIANKNFQDLLARGIADGVENYFYHNK
ncbi:N-acetylmuramoyl-L-alanine amidase [Campylobacter sp. LR264d]|uniref:N-acetylmuramoyl-L-alanine amidase family protein n=1 Tax=Campylobacter sp. LR264d TaxID=2593544 RepID=UPI00123C79BC|nr:N-acetylmuramoyl-L-alanine amidase [Campylobacter sp. LR264d]KAA6230143.1 N-acetylmuramoyl-L-alanine amidase [Campylobacter sp. LR264d]